MTQKHYAKDRLRMGRRIVGIVGSTAMWLVLVGGSTGAVAAPSPPHEVTPLQEAVFPALAAPRATDLPKQIREFGKSRFGQKYGADPRLARLVTAPDSNGGNQQWWVIPSARGICLARLGAATCQSNAGALAGRLYLQSIKAIGNSPVSPLPPAGVPIPSRVVGVAPAGTTSVTASTASGETIVGIVRAGMFAISGSGMTNLQLVRAPLTVPVFSG